jgi:Gas vesicle synthesis protein GvpL/GvpF
MRYIYGVVRENEQKSFDVDPLPGGASVETGPANSGLAFISSDIGDTKPRASRANLLAHTRVLEAVMQQADVLPVRFGTMIESDEDGERVLAKNAAEFARAFAEVEGRYEISLKINWAHDRIFDEVMEDNPTLRHERDMLNASHQGQYSKIDFGKKVEAAVAQIRAIDCGMIVSALQPLSDKMIESPMLDDTMVANLSFLVHRDQLAWFDAGIEKVDLMHRDRWKFRYVGPMPTFSFVDLKIDFNPEKVEG